VIKGIIVAVILIGLSCVFFLEKQHEKKEALALEKRQDEAFIKAYATPLATNSFVKDFHERGPMFAPTGKPKSMLAPTPKPTPMLPKPTPMLPKPTPMLPRSTPMLGRSP
jgi:hypothetical protein